MGRAGQDRWQVDAMGDGKAEVGRGKWVGLAWVR